MLKYAENWTLSVDFNMKFQWKLLFTQEFKYIDAKFEWPENYETIKIP